MVEDRSLISRLSNGIIYISLFLLSMICILPFVYIVVGSVTPSEELTQKGFVLIPSRISWVAYQYIFSTDTLLRSLLVTVFITVCGTFVNLLFTALMATMMNNFYMTEPPKADSPIIKKIEEYTNTKLDIIWVPATAYEDKINASIAAGELPKIVMIRNTRDSAVLNAIRSGMFWEIGPYIDDYPNIKQLNPQVFKNISVDGKIYGIFRARNLTRDGVTIRKDWLEKLNMPYPETVEDLIEVFRAFTYKDPDGNGKDDTYGFSASGLSGWTSFMTWHGGPNGWGIKDGKLQPEFMFDEFYQVLALYKQMYDEKLFNQDFAVVKNATTLINQGKAGVYLGVMDDAISRFTDLAKSDPQAELDVIGKIRGPKGVKIGATSGYNGMFSFPKTSVKSEEELKRLLSFLDKMADKEIQDLLEWGIEGVHYKVENGTRKYIDVQKYNDEVRTPFFQLKYDDGSLAEKGETPELQLKFMRLMKENEDPEIAVHNPTLPFISDTNILKGSELNKIIDDAKVKYVMGEIDENGFKNAVDQWLKQGGEQIIQEYNEQYSQYN